VRVRQDFVNFKSKLSLGFWTLRLLPTRHLALKRFVNSPEQSRTSLRRLSVSPLRTEIAWFMWHPSRNLTNSTLPVQTNFGENHASMQASCKRASVMQACKRQSSLFAQRGANEIVIFSVGSHSAMSIAPEAKAEMLKC
jgi:hypothetical protein